jgi:hypothetical protein
MNENERAMELLMLRRHRVPGATESELISEFGREYEKVLKELEVFLQPLGLEIRGIERGGEKRYFIAFREIKKKTNVPRMDMVSAVVACVAYINAKKERVKREELEGLLKEKFSRRAIEMYLSRALRDGYLVESEGYFDIGWRSYAEIDLKKLSDILTG